jgi:probable F420-dependent oxidoreductase
MAKEFRFGVGLTAARRLHTLQDFARRSEDMGYDVLHMADHLYTTAPFPMLTAVAMATEKLHVGTFVLNAGFYRPALLARDVTSVRDLSGGRFELGLGAGYGKKEFEQAELPYPTGGERVAWLRHVTEHMNQNVPDVPILIAGNGDKLLTLAAERAHIIGLTGGAPATADSDPLADRIAFVRDAAGDRFDELELNISVIAMPTDDSGVPDLSIARRSLPALSEDEMLRTPTVLSGSTKEIADTIRGYRDSYGVTYITVQQLHAEPFAKVIAELR